MSSEEQWDIPSHWCWTTISQIGEVVSGGTPASKEPAYWGGDINWISPADLTGYSEKFIRKGNKSITQEGLKKSSAKLMPAGSVHFSSRAPIGYVAISAEPISTNQGFKSLIPIPGVFNEYIYYYLKGSKQLAERKASGTTFLELSGKAFGLLPVPLPPLPEQRRIVAKIEELLSELDNGIAALKTARKQLKVYRQAVLKQAFEGKFTAYWREENADKLESPEQLLARIQREREARYKQQLREWKAAVKVWEANGKEGNKPKKPKELVKLALTDSALPKGWLTVSLDWLLSIEKKPMTTGPFGTALKKSDHQTEGVPVLGIENIGNGKFVSGNKIFVTEEKAEELSSFRVNPGEVVISRSGTVGEICEVPKGVEGSLISTNLLRVSLDPTVVLSSFFVLMFQGGGVKLQVKNLCKGSSREFLNQSILGSINYPICGVEEQKVLLEELEKIFSNIDQQDVELSKSLNKAESLRQSILKKAFSGQLVPQDPDDEPAGELLDRIRAEKHKGRPSAQPYSSSLRETT